MGERNRILKLGVHAGAENPLEAEAGPGVDRRIAATGMRCPSPCMLQKALDNHGREAVHFFIESATIIEGG
jgi:hypothetical protein